MALDTSDVSINFGASFVRFRSGDFDGDGDWEIVPSYPGWPWPKAETTTVAGISSDRLAFSTGAYFVGDLESGAVPTLPRGFTDVDFDGDTDAVVVGREGFWVLWGIGDGDLNRDGKPNGLDVQVVRAAKEEVVAPTSEYDLNADTVIDEFDVQYLVEEIAGTRLGDADFSGRVDFVDFLALANNFGNQDAVWDEGDFDGDAIVGFDDFLLLAENFGFQQSNGD